MCRRYITQLDLARVGTLRTPLRDQRDSVQSLLQNIGQGGSSKNLSSSAQASSFVEFDAKLLTFSKLWKIRFQRQEENHVQVIAFHRVSRSWWKFFERKLKVLEIIDIIPWSLADDVPCPALMTMTFGLTIFSASPSPS